MVKRWRKGFECFAFKRLTSCSPPVAGTDPCRDPCFPRIQVHVQIKYLLAEELLLAVPGERDALLAKALLHLALTRLHTLAQHLEQIGVAGIALLGPSATSIEFKQIKTMQDKGWESSGMV
eukprot:9489650-Pyramimonas_sp.AAC.1